MQCLTLMALAVSCSVHVLQSYSSCFTHTNSDTEPVESLTQCCAHCCISVSPVVCRFIRSCSTCTLYWKYEREVY